MEPIGLYFSKTQDDVSVCMDCYREHYRVIDVFYPKNERVKEMVLETDPELEVLEEECPICHKTIRWNKLD